MPYRRRGQEVEKRARGRSPYYGTPPYTRPAGTEYARTDLISGNNPPYNLGRVADPAYTGLRRNMPHAGYGQNLPFGDFPGQPMWIGTDSSPRGPGLDGPEFWGGYGAAQPPYDLTAEWGGFAADASQWLDGAGILAAVTRATTLIINPIIRAAWDVMRAETDNMSGDATAPYAKNPAMPIQKPLWIADPQLASRAPTAPGDYARPLLPMARRMKRDEFWSTVLTHALWWGAGTIMYVPNAAGVPLVGTLRIVNPFLIDKTDDGRFVLDPHGDDPLVSDLEGGFNVGPVRWQVAQMRGLPPHDDRTPEGVLTRHGWVIRSAAKLQRYGDNSLSSGVPAGLLRVSIPNFGEREADELKARWMRAHGGDRRGVAVLNAGVDFSPLSISPVDADLTKLRQLSLVDIAHAFGLSAALLDASAGSSLTYANLQERRREKLDDVLAPWGSRLEQMISSLLPFGTHMQINWQSYLATDPAQTIDYVRTAIDTGVMTVPEGRAVLGLPVQMEDANSGDTGTSNEERAARMLQMIYLGVGRVITVEEARRMMIAAGVQLDANVTLDDIRESLPPKSQTFGEAMGEEPAA